MTKERPESDRRWYENERRIKSTLLKQRGFVLQKQETEKEDPSASAESETESRTKVESVEEIVFNCLERRLPELTTFRLRKRLVTRYD